MKRRELIRASVLTSVAAAVVHPPSAIAQSTVPSAEEDNTAKIVVRRHFANQTAVIPQTAIFTPSADGLFRVSAYLETGNDDPTTGIHISLTWTDDYEFRSSAVSPPEGTGWPVQGGNAQGNVGTTSVRMKAGTPFSIQTSVPDGSTIATPYSFYIVIERL